MALRFMDEIEAGPHIERWLEGLATKVRAHPEWATSPFWDIEYRRHEQSDGKTVLVWWKRRLIGVAVSVRDEMNFTVFQICGPDDEPRPSASEAER